MFSLQLNSRNISWQLSSIEGREGGELVERRPVEGTHSLSLFRRRKNKGKGRRKGAIAQFFVSVMLRTAMGKEGSEYQPHYLRF